VHHSHYLADSFLVVQYTTGGGSQGLNSLVVQRGPATLVCSILEVIFSPAILGGKKECFVESEFNVCVVYCGALNWPLPCHLQNKSHFLLVYVHDPSLVVDILLAFGGR
jgi:hypothetical protein